MRLSRTFFERALLVAILANLNIAVLPAEDWISGEEDLKRKLRAKYGDALGKEIKINYQVPPENGYELPPVQLRDSASQTGLSDKEMRQLFEEEARRERWSQKELISTLYMASVWGDQYTELSWYDDGKFLRALVNANVTQVNRNPWIETETQVFHPLILVAEVDPSPTPSSAVKLWSPDGTTYSQPSLLSDTDLELLGAELGYIVGYDKAASLGTDEDYAGIEAILDAIEEILANGSDE